jgi:ABC-type microcin C transport system permease subunit YejB
MRSRHKSRKGLVAKLILVKRAIGAMAVLGVFYLTVPWGMINAVGQGEGLTTAEFTKVITAWATGLADNILLIVLLLFIAVLTYGPEALDLVAGSEKGNSPPGPRY